MGFASPAIRALHTAMIFTRGVSLPLGNFGVRDRLYDFSGESVMDFIADLDDALDSVLIFGHNHALTHLANSLGNTYIDNVPTAGLVHLGFDTPHWKSVSKGITVQTLFPKKL